MDHEDHTPKAAASGDDERTDVTSLLQRASAGDPQASSELLPVVYQQLRALARRHMRREQRAGLTLQATALVHEAYLRLVHADTARQQRWDGRGHFFAAAAEAMRRLLVDNARRRGRLKRGGARRRIEFDQLERAEGTIREPPEDLLALDEALELLARNHPEKAQVVKLRYFAGLTIEEAAEAQGISVPTANRYWAFARAWLFHHLSDESPPMAR